MSRRTPPKSRSSGSGPRHSGTSPQLSGFEWRSLLWYGCVMVPLVLWYLVIANGRMVLSERALGRGEFREAFTLAMEELQADPFSDRALMVAGSVCRSLNDPAGAKSFFERVSQDHPPFVSQVERELGRIALDSGFASEAEERLRKCLEITPDDSACLDHLIYLLTLEGRSWEARQLVLNRLRSGVVTPNYLTIASTPHPTGDFAQTFATQCLSAIPDDPLPRLVLARKAWRDDDPQKARSELELVLRKYPNLLEAHALLCLVLAESGTSGEFQLACSRLPPDADAHPEIWLARGIWASNHNQQKAAARCFWQSLRIEPNFPNANYRLSQELVKLGQPDVARPFAERAKHLTSLSFEVTSLMAGIDPNKLESVVRQLEALGRDWEAVGWCRMLQLQKNLEPPWARETQARLYRRLLASDSWAAAAIDPSRKIDLSGHALPVFGDEQKPPSTPAPSPPPLSQIKFEEEAERAGLRFTYRNGALTGDLESMLEMNGGGVAVLDYDGDSRPDVFFTQGGPLPPAPFDAAQRDQLYRNQFDADSHASSGGAFVRVTELAGLHDLGYGQGTTVGDFDNDGFSDLYVGNIGQNQLYQNNGDGTFSDITETAGVQAGGWTSSCVLADLNQDALPDLFVVNYLGGEKVFEPCSKRASVRCSPLNFPAEQDRLYLNLGDGRFRDISETSGVTTPEGRGLGVMCADFDGSRRLSLFVANDMSANFYFVNQTTAPDAPQFVEQALLSGLAFDNQGQAKACMGIASGDFNQDSLLDLFVTNFYRQSNDLYLQQPGGLFRDESREADLYHSSFLQLGWGTQALDADLDGHSDLVVTNGHVHEPLDPLVPYDMPPQFFRNRGNGTFEELSSTALGQYFQQKWSGRSLTKLDWNRDGKQDVCISPLNQPAALLTNQAESTGHRLSMRLVAVDSARDAIGTTVRVTAGGQTWTQQLTAGDGFQASNERQLVFGLGQRPAVDSVEVEWPSGSRQQFPNLGLDQEWIFVEHRWPLKTGNAESSRGE